MLFPREHSSSASAQWRSDEAQSNRSPEDRSLIQTHHHFVSHCAGEICVVRQPGISCCVVPLLAQVPSPTHTFCILVLPDLSCWCIVSYQHLPWQGSTSKPKLFPTQLNISLLTKYWLWNRKGQLSYFPQGFFLFFPFLWNHKGFQLNKYKLINVHLRLHRKEKNGLPHLICELFHFR